MRDKKSELKYLLKAKDLLQCVLRSQKRNFVAERKAYQTKDDKALAIIGLNRTNTFT